MVLKNICRMLLTSLHLMNYRGGPTVLLVLIQLGRVNLSPHWGGEGGRRDSMYPGKDIIITLVRKALTPPTLVTFLKI